MALPLNPKGVPASSPGLADEIGLPWVTVAKLPTLKVVAESIAGRAPQPADHRPAWPRPGMFGGTPNITRGTRVLPINPLLSN